MKFSFLFGSSAILLATFATKTANAASSCPADWSSRSAGETWDSSVTGVDGTHRLSLPASYDNPSVPLPVILYFHGWGGGTGEGDSFCQAANGRGYACIRLEGMAGPGEYNSWNGFGSTESGVYDGTQADPFPDGTVSDFTLPGCSSSQSEAGRTCNVDAYDVGCYSDCSGACVDDCWWTTCKDSVEQTVTILDCFAEAFDVDESKIFAVGCSNGGMFTFDLATDARIAPRLAAIAPQIGLPHYGFNFGPVDRANGDLYGHISMIGMWGSRDGTVPPEEGASSTGCTLPCRATENGGWFYTASDCVLDRWALELGLPSAGNYDDGKSRTDCEVRSSSSSSTEVVGCIFSGGHVCNNSYQTGPILDFFDAHPKAVDACTGDAKCDDGSFCNGAETCGSGGACLPGSDPCPGQGCDEDLDACVVTTTTVATTTTSTTTTTDCGSIPKKNRCRRAGCTWRRGRCIPN